MPWWVNCSDCCLHCIPVVHQSFFWSMPLPFIGFKPVCQVVFGLVNWVIDCVRLCFYIRRRSCASIWGGLVGRSGVMVFSCLVVVVSVESPLCHLGNVSNTVWVACVIWRPSSRAWFHWRMSFGVICRGLAITWSGGFNVVLSSDRACWDWFLVLMCLFDAVHSSCLSCVALVSVWCNVCISVVGGCVGVVVVLVWWLVCCWVDWVHSVVSIVSWSCCVPWSRCKWVCSFHFECLDCFISSVECWIDCFFLWGWVSEFILSVWECRFFRIIVLFCHFFSSIGVCGVFKP